MSVEPASENSDFSRDDNSTRGDDWNAAQPQPVALNSSEEVIDEEFEDDDFDEEFDDDFEEEVDGEYDLEDDRYGEEFNEEFGHLTKPADKDKKNEKKK